MNKLPFSTPRQAYNYMFDYGKNSVYKEEAEKIISTDSKISYYYAKNILQKRWKQAEKTILIDYAFEYTVNVIQGRYPKCEKIFINEKSLNDYNEYSFYLNLYIKVFFKNRWKKIENIIKISNNYMSKKLKFDHD